MTQSSKILERREREKREMTETIVKAAREMFLEQGYDKVSIRKLADRIAYSPGTIYNYFKNKDEIFSAVHEQGFQVLFELMAKHLNEEDPMIRLQKMGEEYWSFAMAHPDDYDLMFVLRAPMNAEENEEDWACGHRTFQLLIQTVMDCQAKGHLQDHDPRALSFMVWSTMHGMVTLVIRDRLKMYEEGIRKELGRLGMDTLNALLRAKES